MKIIKLEIRNFRSIQELSVDCNYFTIFVGRNDVGKSNIIRALNLFFNNETDFATRFDFSRDYSKYAVEKKKKAKEIFVRLTIEPPENYSGAASGNLVWTKKWRADSDTPIETMRLEGNDGVPPYSKLPSLLRKIRFRYIPAIKDQNYFRRLLGEVYTVLSDVAADKLKSSAKHFEQQISKDISDLTTSLKEALEIESKLSLPSNLSHIFENLDFQSESIPLACRGDGVKAQHIPIILEFIADKQNELYNMGSIWSYTIWGYEEPENNIELSNCFRMANKFLEYIDKDIIVFTTTHSPAFYSLMEKEYVTVHAINKDYGAPTIITKANRNKLDFDLGLMPLVAPYIEQKQNELEELAGIHSALKDEIESHKKPTIFVEGPSDQIVLQKAIEVFFPEHTGKIIVTGPTTSGGYNFVKDRLLSWGLQHKHSAERRRAAGLFDKDREAEAIKKITDEMLNIFDRERGSAKTFSVTKNAEILDLAKLGFQLPADLEFLYSLNIWKFAQGKNWLVKREGFHEILKPATIDEMVKGQDPRNKVASEKLIFIEWTFDDFCKIKAAKHVVKLPNNEFAKELAAVRDTLSPIVKFLSSNLPLQANQ